MERHEFRPTSDHPVERTERDARDFFAERSAESESLSLRRPIRLGPTAMLGRLKTRNRYAALGAGIVVALAIGTFLASNEAKWNDADTSPLVDRAPANLDPTSVAAFPIAPAVDGQLATVPMHWQGAVLPTSEAGPATITKNRAYSFARTSLGAALAAAHIAVRVDPLTGPAVFVPTVRQQTKGDSGAWTARLQEIYRDIANRRGVRRGVPIYSAPGFIEGWRIASQQIHATDPPLRRAEVDLLVRSPDGERKIFHVLLKWVQGDWVLVLPNVQKKYLFRTQDAKNIQSFTPFFDW